MENYEVTISCPADSMYATSKNFENLDDAMKFVESEIRGELKDNGEISIVVTKYID